ncbi:MAG TPA: DUF488 family protein [Patescibacteria group bacterium]
MDIRIKRIYEKPSKDDGKRILVDRLWPRGISKADAGIDLWLKDAAPSSELRKFLHENPQKNYKNFAQKYAVELRKNKVEIVETLGKTNRNITLITSVKEIEHSHIPTLVEFMKKII